MSRMMLSWLGQGPGQAVEPASPACTAPRLPTTNPPSHLPKPPKQEEPPPPNLQILSSTTQDRTRTMWVSSQTQPGSQETRETRRDRDVEEDKTRTAEEEQDNKAPVGGQEKVWIVSQGLAARQLGGSLVLSPRGAPRSPWRPQTAPACLAWGRSSSTAQLREGSLKKKNIFGPVSQQGGGV